MTGVNFMPLLGYGGLITASRAYVTRVSDATDLTTYTFTAASIGTATTSDYLVLCVGFRANAVARSISSVTLDTVGCTAAVTTGGAAATGCGIFITPHTGNTTGDIVVTFSGAVQRMSVDVYTARNINPTTTDTAAVTSGNPLALSVDSLERGLVFGIGNTTANAATPTWVGITQDANGSVEAASTFSSASEATSSSTTPLTVTCSWSTSTTPAGASCVFNHS